MEKQEILDKVREIISDKVNLDKDKINEELNLRTDIEADSIDFVEFVMQLEDTFGDEISDDDASKLTTVADVVNYIYDHQK